MTAKLIYFATRSLDGYVEDAHGNVRDMKSRATQDLVVGGHELASHAFRAGLVDEIKLFIAPIIVGGGKRSFPDGEPVSTQLPRPASLAVPLRRTPSLTEEHHPLCLTK